MDDKSLNLWRQIERCRRLERDGQRRGLPLTPDRRDAKP
jgi:hypothetical protein